MMMTIMAMSVVVVPNVGATASAGDLIKMNGLSSVYYLGADGKRYVFPNESTYFSWYSDFSGVVTVPQSELEGYPLGANVTVRPGTKLVKITTNPTVYAVEPGGTLRAIASEANAITLYGANWAKRVIDVPDAFFTNYKTGTALAAGVYPVGSLVKTSASADVYYYDGTNYRKIASETAFIANKFDFSNVVTSASAITSGGTAVAAAESTLTDTSSGAGGTAGAGTGLTVALSSATALSSTLIYGQANANLATFNFTASNDGPVTVKTLKVKRVGISSDALLTAAYLYEGSNRLTDNATVSANYITFNNAAGLFTVAAGTTKSITVKSNISSTTTDGANVAVAINAASDVTATGASVTGSSFPLTGNTMGVSSATLASFTFNVATTPATSNVDAGQSNYTLWKNVTTIGNRDIILNSIRLRQIGSVAYTDLKDLSFYVDGVMKGSTQQLGSDGYVTFDFSSSPVTLLSGGRTLEVRGNIIGGSSKTYSFSLQQATDLVASDSQYNAYVTAINVPATTGTQTVNPGTLTVTKLSDSPSGNITKDASGATLGKFEFKAYGESMKVEYLKAGYASSDGDIGKLRNGALYAYGTQIGSTADLKKNGDNGTTFSLGSSLIVTPGTTVTVEVRADIYDNDGINNVNAADTFIADLITYTNGAQRQSSLGYVDVPTAQVIGGTLTVQTGTIALSKQTTYGNQNVVVPKTGYKLGSFVLTGNNIEDTTINSFEVAFTPVTNATFSKDDLNDVYLKYGSKSSTVKSTVNATANIWSVSETLAKNGNMTIEVWGNIGSTITALDSMKTQLLVSGTTVGSTQTVTTNGGVVLDGQTIIATAGSIASSLDATATVSKIAVGNGVQDLGAFRFTTTNDNYTLTEAVIKVADAAAASNIVSLSLKDGANAVATVPVAGTSATFSGLSLPITANGYKVLTVAGNLGTVGFGAGNTGANIVVTLDSFKANNSQGTETADGTDRAGNAIYVYKATPTISNQTLPTTLLSAGTLTIAKFSIANNTDTIAWKKLTIGVSKSANPTIAALAGANGTGSVTLYDETNTAIPGTIAFAGLVGGAASANVTFTATSEQLVSGSKPYTLKATIGGAPVAGDSVSTTIANGVVAYAVPAAYTGTADAYAGFVWSDQAGDTTTPTHSATSLDWNNDWLVKNIPTDSQTLAK